MLLSLSSRYLNYASLGFQSIPLPTGGSAGPNSVLIRPASFGNIALYALIFGLISAQCQSQCYSVKVWCEGTQGRVILGLDNQRNQKFSSLSNHHLNNASLGIRSIPPPEGRSAGPTSVLIRPVQFDVTEFKLAFTANPTPTLIILAALDKNPEDHMLQPPLNNEKHATMMMST